ncbi:MAG TPA: SpoIVB peptidase S55 domain-containing protein [Terriglobales bacterium]|nr:SpoIVB peptidase S55 domain-containing protein [Terriglobales bacterium]
MKSILSYLARIFPLVLLCSMALAQTPAAKPQGARVAPEIMSVSELHRGMRGVAYTVFEGTKPEAMDVEILGVLPNLNGPKSDLILARLHGDKVEFTGVVAGMSGSPVYVDGKLVGAISYRIGQFSKEPIAGITPIEEMLEIDAMDRSQPEPVSASRAPKMMSKTSVGDDASADLQNFASLMQPIDAPFVFSGFTEDTIRQFSTQFAQAGLKPVMGVGSASHEHQPEPIEPGSAVSAVLVSGDLDIAATCTVTYIDPQRLLACGHPLTQYGMVDMPMTKANVVATLASPYNSYKIVNTTDEVGTFVQDRHSGILGRFGEASQMIPVMVTIHGGSKPKQMKFSVLNNAKLTPLIMMTAVFQALQSQNQYGDQVTYRMNGDIAVNGYPSVHMHNMFSSNDTAPSSVLAALNLGDHFGRIFENPYTTPGINGVNLDFDVTPERRAARLETARTDVTEARPGDEITVEAVLRPYRGDPIVRQIPVKIPTSVPRGQLRILVSDSETLDRSRKLPSSFGRTLQLGSTIDLLNKEHANNNLYVSLLEANPEAMVEDKVMPTLPLSVMNVMQGMRNGQDMYVSGESAVDETSTPMDYVVSGAQLLTVQIK